MASFVDNTIFTALSGGTGDFVVAAATPGYQSPAGRVVDGEQYRYRAQTANLLQWEIGIAIASVGGTVFTRSVQASSTGGVVNFLTPPNIMLTFSSVDFLQSSLLTTRGDLLYRNATVPARLAKGAVNTLLTMGADDPAWATLSALLDAAIGSTRGMVLTRGAATWGALAVGAEHEYLVSDGADVGWASHRESLTADRTYYIRADGSDSNDGLANTSGGAFLTKQHAYDLMCATLDKNGHDIIFQIADSTTYTDGVLMAQPWTGGGAVIWQGNSGTPTNVRINVTAGDCFKATGGLPGTVVIKDMELRTTTTGNCVNQSAAGLIEVQNLVFGASQVHINIGSAKGGSGANLDATGNLSFGAATFASIAGSRPCNINLAGRQITFLSTPAIATFLLTDNGACCYMAGVTWVGTFTGKRYATSNNAVINTGGQATTWIPGTVAGTGTNAGTTPFGLYV